MRQRDSEALRTRQSPSDSSLRAFQAFGIRRGIRYSWLLHIFLVFSFAQQRDLRHNIREGTGKNMKATPEAEAKTLPRTSCTEHPAAPVTLQGPAKKAQSGPQRSRKNSPGSPKPPNNPAEAPNKAPKRCPEPRERTQQKRKIKMSINIKETSRQNDKWSARSSLRPNRKSRISQSLAEPGPSLEFDFSIWSKAASDVVASCLVLREQGSCSDDEEDRGRS